MIPCEDPNAETGHDDDLSEETLELSKETIIDAADSGISTLFRDLANYEVATQADANLLSLRRETP